MPIFESTVSQRDQFRKAASDQPGEALRKGKVLYYTNIALTYFIAGVLMFAGVSKIIGQNNIAKTLGASFSFINNDVLFLIAALLPIIEIVLGFAIVFKFKENYAIIISAILFFLFTTYTFYGIASGVQESCGCFGNVLKSSFDWWMLTRNLVLLVLSVYLAVILNWKKQKNNVKS